MALLLALIPSASRANPAAKGKDANRKKMDAAFFERNIRPILVEHCYECHSEAEGERKGGLLLDRESGWLEGGELGRAVVPGQPGDSLLVSAIRRTDEDLSMPPKYALEKEEVDLLVRWVREGAPGPAEDVGATEFSQLGDQEVIFEKAESHWAFQPVADVDPPQVPVKAWAGHPVDRFIFAKLREHSLAPSPPAKPRDLVRRLSYDLTGLPPEEEDYAKETGVLIDQWLESPRFGEHFARMWLDVARYADTAGSYRPDTKTPHYYPYAFTYRDYVIDAYNSDKPYDRFVKEQLAADLLGAEEPSAELAALGFLAASPHRSKTHDYVDDVIDTTTRGFLGLTVSCARCHDHKFEPVPTADYYSLYGVFHSVDRPGFADFEDFPAIGGYRPNKGEKASFEKERAAIEREIEQAGDKKRRGNNRSVAQSIRETKLAELLLFHEGAPARAMALGEAKRPTNPKIFIRGDAANRGESVPRRFLRILDPGQKPFPKDASGRLQVAEKIADPGNPLTARVYVNRVWGFLMGDHLVDTPSDFGLQGNAPSHPELLDWLAADFVEHGWSSKHLVRRIVSSRTYQQRSRHREEAAASDPENQFYWRANRKRLSIEEIRDSLLALSGELDPSVGGRSDRLWDPGESKRRSVYGYINRFNLDPTLRNFDFPSPMQTRADRPESIVSPQALFLMNAPFVRELADALVEGLGFKERTEPEERIQSIFGAVHHRPADRGETERSLRFAEIELNRDVDPWPLLAQSLFMSNEFLYVD